LSIGSRRGISVWKTHALNSGRHSRVPSDRRDPIDVTHGRVRAVAEEAYFYAALVFGVTLSTAG